MYRIKVKGRSQTALLVRFDNTGAQLSKASYAAIKLLGRSSLRITPITTLACGLKTASVSWKPTVTRLHAKI